MRHLFLFFIEPILAMNNKRILDQMGIQQWRLNDVFKDENQISLKETPISPKEVTQPVIDSPLSPGADSVTTDQTLKSNHRIESAADPVIDWSMLIEILNDKQRCSSCAQVTPILGEGDTSADWMFVIDSPSTRDIQQQELLTGRVGQLFDAILHALQLDRATIYLSSIFKCPPAVDITEDPAQCIDLLQHQINLVKPKVVIALGEFASQSLIKANEDLTELRGQTHTCFGQSVSVIATYSLMQMLDTPTLKADVWADLKSASVLQES